MTPLEKGMQRFSYIKYDEKAQSLSECIKGHCNTLECFINNLPESREKSLALTKLEEFFMWTGKAIRNDQIKRLDPAPQPDQPARGEMEFFWVLERCVNIGVMAGYVGDLQWHAHDGTDEKFPAWMETNNIEKAEHFKTKEDAQAVLEQIFPLEAFSEKERPFIVREHGWMK